MDKLGAFLTTPLFGVLLTLSVWAASMRLRQASKTALLNPVALSVVTIIIVLSFSGVSYDEFNAGGQLITFLLGPAVVAMAVPLYRRRDTLRRYAGPLLGGVVVGSVAGIASAVLTARVLGASEETLLSVAPKSVTTPIAMEITQGLGGIPSLSAALVIITGMLGAMVGPEFLRWIGVNSTLAQGLALGTAAHGIGTARAFEEGELMGSMSSLGMILNGLATAVLMPIVLPLCL